MTTCPSCGGILGQDCFNVEECAEITSQMGEETMEPDNTPEKRAWRVRPYEAKDWLITYDPPTAELRRYMEFVEISQNESQP